MNYKMIISKNTRKQNLIPPQKKKEMSEFIKEINYLKENLDYNLKIDKYSNEGTLIIDLDSMKINDLKYLYENFFEPYIE